jgi:hypothetical protein
MARRPTLSRRPKSRDRCLQAAQRKRSTRAVRNRDIRLLGEGEPAAFQHQRRSVSTASLCYCTSLVTLQRPRLPDGSPTMARGSRTSERGERPRRGNDAEFHSPESTSSGGLALRDVVAVQCVWRKVERGGRTIIPPRLSAPPRRLRSRRDFVWPTARPVHVLD